jgi:uncharacterized protein YdeI (YjbR/CyaY-like superfamily)
MKTGRDDPQGGTMATKKSASANGDDELVVRRNPRVDTYIADAAPFARPILAHLRHIVHQTCPEAVEAIKWSMPFFTYRDTNLCHLAAFKAHCAFGFWRGKEIDGLPDVENGSSMGDIGRIESLDDVPSKRDLTRWLKAAMKLTDGGTKPVRAQAVAPKASVATPDDLAAAIGASGDAKRHYDAFSSSAKREYVEWIVEAKREATRAQRIVTAVEWIAEGKQRNWKYQK